MEKKPGVGVVSLRQRPQHGGGKAGQPHVRWFAELPMKETTRQGRPVRSKKERNPDQTHLS